MLGQMMDFPLTLSAVFRRAETLYGYQEIVTRAPDRTLRRYRYADFTDRTRRLAAALRELGVRRGDRVATLCWNHHQHLEAYFAVPILGAVLHTLNLRLHPDELAYIINHAEDKVVIVDRSLLPLFERIRPSVNVATAIVVDATAGLASGLLDYESLLAKTAPASDLPDVPEQDAAALCYTTGTTGRPKGVLYSHRSLVMHSFGIALADSMGVGEADAVTPVVPMFHANAWGLPFGCVMVGSKLVLPGPYLDPPSLADLFERERVTITAGVPTIWMGLLQLLDEHPVRYDLSNLRMVFVGGAAAPRAMIEAFEQRHRLLVVQGWGMTETCPVAALSHLPTDMRGREPAAQYGQRAKAGRPLPFVEIRARNEDGLVPWDGHTMGELEIRGPWVVAEYFNDDTGASRFTEDGWFKTGDIVTLDEYGTISIQDRTKDLIKSGGEWISSIAIENTLMGHPAVAEAAVIPVAHPKWGERPLAAVVLKAGQSVTCEELTAFLAPSFPKFWLPNAFEFIDAIPRTSTGKFKKSALRERFKDYQLPAS